MRGFDELVPAQIVAGRAAAPTAYLPVGPLEWHGPHLPLGTDPIHAWHVASEVAGELGGVVLPPLFAGTETVVPAHGRPHNLAGMGLRPDDRVVGMDFPGNSVTSLYFEESVFALTVREMIRGIRRNGFRRIVIVNGHGAANQKSALSRVAAEETDPSGTEVVVHHAWVSEEPGLPGMGHAARYETSVMSALRPESVHLELLPPRPEPLRYRDFAIVDGPAFAGRPTPDFTLREEYDPRLSDAAEGRTILAAEIRHALASLTAAA